MQQRATKESIKSLDSVTHTGDYNHAWLILARIQSTSSNTFNTNHFKIYKLHRLPSPSKKTTQKNKNNRTTYMYPTFLKHVTEQDIFFYLSLSK